MKIRKYTTTLTHHVIKPGNDGGANRAERRAFAKAYRCNRAFVRALERKELRTFEFTSTTLRNACIALGLL